MHASDPSDRTFNHNHSFFRSTTTLLLPVRVRMRVFPPRPTVPRYPGQFTRSAGVLGAACGALTRHEVRGEVVRSPGATPDQWVGAGTYRSQLNPTTARQVCHKHRRGTKKRTTNSCQTNTGLYEFLERERTHQRWMRFLISVHGLDFLVCVLRLRSWLRSTDPGLFSVQRSFL